MDIFQVNPNFCFLMYLLTVWNQCKINVSGNATHEEKNSNKGEEIFS